VTYNVVTKLISHVTVYRRNKSTVYGDYISQPLKFEMKKNVKSKAEFQLLSSVDSNHEGHQELKQQIQHVILS
jgi:hypothetical protein